MRKVFQVSFLKIYRKTQLFVKNLCFQIRIFFLNALVVIFSNPVALGRQLLNNYWLLLTFQLRNFSFSVNFWRYNYLEPPMLSPFVFLCLISPDFATCSLALHRHVFSNVIKRLSTIATLGLSTSTPVFYVFNIFCLKVYSSRSKKFNILSPVYFYSPLLFTTSTCNLISFFPLLWYFVYFL